VEVSVIRSLSLELIDPSPFQVRKYFSEASLDDLAKSIARDGLVEPIVVRPVGARFELIAGERRWRAIQRIAGATTIAASLHEVSDLQARRMGAAENLQRTDLSPIETAYAVVEMVDAELIEAPGYSALGPTSLARVKGLLMKLDSDRRMKTDYYSSKFTGIVEKIFTNLPKPMEWVSFYTNDLPPITRLDADVRDLAIEQRLNKAQTKELAHLKKTAPQKFAAIQAQRGVEARQDLHDWEAQEPVVPLREVSARELRQVTTMARLDQARVHLEPVSTPPLPAGAYRCLVIDPPWPMQKSERKARPGQGVALDYPTMTLEEIAALPIADKAADGCHVYLWVTHRFLWDGLELLAAWGFTYQCALTWVKPSGMTPFSWMYNTEHVLFGYRGSLPLTRVGLKLSFAARATRHSEKPEAFYELVRAASPEPCLELFARRAHRGFLGWGDEVSHGATV